MIETIEGVSMAQYAGVTAALADEVPLAEALANERIAITAWPGVDAAWKEALAEGGVEGPAFKAFAVKRAQAEDWLSRSVKPIEDDLAGWIRFLRAYEAHTAPFELLTAAGMRLADLARLGRRWQKRFAANRELGERAAELRKAPLEAPPKITVGKFELKPFPWSPGATVEAKAEAVAAAVEAAGVEAGLSLDRYAALRVELTQPKADRVKVAARYGIEPSAIAGIDAAWKARLAADPALDRDFRQLFAYQRSRLAAAAKFVPRDPNAPPPALTGTVLSLDRSEMMVLPFVEGEAPPEISFAGEVSEEPRARPDPSLAGTALAIEVPRGSALPFDGGPIAAPPQMAGTALAIEVPRGIELPFVEGEAPPEISFASEEPRAPLPFTGTADITASVAAELPFEPSPEAKPAVEAPVMSIEQYASLVVELEQGIESEVLARYRIDGAQRAALEASFARRFTRVPAQRKSFEIAKETYRAWLASTRR